MSAQVSEREEALRAELVAAARDLREADQRASAKAPYCPRCGVQHTARVADVELRVLLAARNLAALLAETIR